MVRQASGAVQIAITLNKRLSHEKILPDPCCRFAHHSGCDSNRSEQHFYKERSQKRKEDGEKERVSEDQAVLHF
jgi:hypothetical protein